MPMVVFVLIDGLRPDTLAVTRSPNLKRLRDSGSHTLRARSVMPSVTLPCHTSIFHSVPPTRHGVTTNIWTPMARPLPGLVDVAHTAGLRSGFFFNWEPLRNLNVAENLYVSYFVDNSIPLDGDEKNMPEFIRLIKLHAPDFAFVYIGNVDTAGHVHGWMSDGYLAQVEQADTLLGNLLDSLPSDCHVLLQSDHGGHDRSHGTEALEDMTIPWIVAGPRIRKGYEITAPVSLLDTAPTLARLLGIEPHSAWEGHCIEEIFA